MTSSPGVSAFSPVILRWRTSTRWPSTISVVPACPWRPNGNRLQPPKRHLSLVMMQDRKMASSSNQKEEAIRQPDDTDTASASQTDLRFDKLQLSEGELECKHKRVFGQFVAREAVIDEEFWTAAWLRAESNWEDQPKMRHAESFKRQFAQQEFTALKRRCDSQLAEKCTCIIAVKREERNVKHTILRSIVGTLGLSIRHFKSSVPGLDLQKQITPVISSIYKIDRPRYGYVANVCVSKYARRQGIASNMLQLAIEAAKSYGVCQIFVHVHKDNIAAQKLYGQIGFQMVEMAPSHSVEEQNYLMCFKT